MIVIHILSNSFTHSHVLFAHSSLGLVEQINNFQTLSLKDFPLSYLDPFLTIHEDYFYHTQNPRRPEVSTLMNTFHNSDHIYSHGHVFNDDAVKGDLFFL